MVAPLVLLLDTNHQLIPQQLSDKGFVIHEDYTSSYEEVKKKIHLYDGLVIRSRIPIDADFLGKAEKLKFIARVGAGMENIDCDFAQKRGIALINSPEGNRDAVAEHVLGMLLVLMNRLFIASQEVKNGIWLREENSGDEIMGKTFGIIGYGNMGNAVAKRLSGFGAKVIFHDILPNLSNQYATQVDLKTLQKEADILSLHLPQTIESKYIINERFIDEMGKEFYFINTARGNHVKTSALVKGLKSGKVKAAALDVLEFEKASFENISETSNTDLKYLLDSEKVMVTPHIAGKTFQSKVKLAQTIVDKILKLNL